MEIKILAFLLIKARWKSLAFDLQPTRSAPWHSWTNTGRATPTV